MFIVKIFIYFSFRLQLVESTAAKHTSKQENKAHVLGPGQMGSFFLPFSYKVIFNVFLKRKSNMYKTRWVLKSLKHCCYSRFVMIKS